MWQLGSNAWQLRGVQNGGDRLTSLFEEPVMAATPKRRGPRTEFSDPQLHNRREQLVQAFAAAWGEIGWELRRCQKPSDLIRIFTLFSETYVRDIIAVLCCPSAEPVSSATPRKVRAKRRLLVEPIRQAYELKRQAQEQLQRADQALFQAPGINRRMLKRARKRRRREACKSLQDYRALSDEERRLDARLKDLESSFARNEVFRFLKSRRYELTPLSLANAVAGLPYMGWRQSMRRNAKARSLNANGSSYQIFKAIRYLVATATKKTERTFITDIRESIPALPSRYRAARNELADRWMYLERAIRQTYRLKLHPKALPFEIMKRYFIQIRCQSQVDMILAEQSRLNVPGHGIRKLMVRAAPNHKLG